MAKKEQTKMRRATDADYEAHVSLYRRYYNDEDDGSLFDDDEEDTGEPEYVLSTPGCSQVYTTYAKALEGYNIHYACYIAKGWTIVLEHKSRRAITIDGEEVRALRVLFRRGRVNKEITLTIRIDID